MLDDFGAGRERDQHFSLSAQAMRVFGMTSKITRAVAASCNLLFIHDDVLAGDKIRPNSSTIIGNMSNRCSASW